MNSKKIFVDKSGKLDLIKTPNLPLVVWLVSTFLTKILPSGNWNHVFVLTAFASLLVWCYLEIFEGTSYFRQVLGAIILLLIIHSRL